MIRLLLLALLCLPGAAAAQTVAVTFDDLPYVSVPAEDDAALADLTARLLQQLRDANANAVGFVNESRLTREGGLVPARVELLRAWLRAGFRARLCSDDEQVRFTRIEP